jgi:uncharacterized protein (TIGR04255 family)
MDGTFRNAPLLEIIAELRWQPAYPLVQAVPQLGTQATIPPLILGTVQIDNFLHRFGGKMFELGFLRMERIYPGGLPVMQGQAIARYKSDALRNIIYQVGAGVFSANAVAPYRSWNHFSPDVEKGIEALLQTREENEKGLPFNPVSLRYIDSFRPDLTGGRDVADFLAEVLKIDLRLPEAISKHVAPGKSPKPYIMLAIPLVNGVLRINVGEAFVNGVATTLLDTTFSTEAPLSPEKSAIMSALNFAHSTIHEIFMKITEPIQSLMQPEQ